MPRQSGAVQLDLFGHVVAAYTESPSGVLNNDDLYSILVAKGGLDKASLEERSPIGVSGAMHNQTKRRVRWFQQSLKSLKVIERVEGQRGVWRLTEEAGKGLHKAANEVKLIAFSTDLGLAIWGRCQDVFTSLDEPISLAVSSPPYLLRQPRAYGNPSEPEYVDFICIALEPIVRNLVPGGSIVLNLGQDAFVSKSPARSLYLERLILALHDRLGLSLMDRIPWVNYSKPPGPTWWSCVNRVQLTASYEPVIWMTNDPSCVRSDNRRVLQAHSEKHLKLIGQGGERRSAVYGDGAYRIRPNDFGRHTEGRIPRNVIERGHACADTLAYRQHARRLGLPLHGAMHPTAIADFFIRFLTEPDELVVDPFGGTVRTGLAAERLGRRWLVSEWILQYLRGSAELFRGYAGFSMHQALDAVGAVD
ncbi:DNA methyltransferase [Ralstonia pseudosolanacearum]|uniref:DNA methyltransferase n=1 Tax=Ralstonia pseudosolanacearum TaxID=1310165 RepID=UPI003CEC73D1